jgi:serine/threonine-protein kinase
MDLPVAIGEIVANKYRIDRLIGTGGMGIVVAAFHLELEQPVAIKFLNSETGARADANERFRREARAAARIRSEHVARVLDIELLDNRLPYMVMELLEGHDLERELEQAGPLPVA